MTMYIVAQVFEEGYPLLPEIFKIRESEVEKKITELHNEGYIILKNAKSEEEAKATSCYA